MSRLIDADTLKELFSEVIGHIAKKPEMNGNLEHMIRASAMVIQMIDDAPTVNALNCSEFPNNSDTISRQKAFEYFVALWECIGTIMDRDEWEDACITTANEIPSAQPAQSYTIHSDGRLWVTVDDIEKVNAVVVDESKSKFCKQFYMDAQPEPKRGKWILDRSGAYYCSKRMEPCAGYVMMKPRDKFCKMCGSRNEVME